MRTNPAHWSLAVVAVVALALVARPALGATPPTGPSGSQPVVTALADHPEIQDAIGALERARDHLRHASHDFGGHREAALRAIDVALRQLHACMDFEK